MHQKWIHHAPTMYQQLMYQQCITLQCISAVYQQCITVVPQQYMVFDSIMLNYFDSAIKMQQQCNNATTMQQQCCNNAATMLQQRCNKEISQCWWLGLCVCEVVSHVMCAVVFCPTNIYIWFCVIVVHCN